MKEYGTTLNDLLHQAMHLVKGMDGGRAEATIIKGEGPAVKERFEIIQCEHLAAQRAVGADLLLQMKRPGSSAKGLWRGVGVAGSCRGLRPLTTGSRACRPTAWQMAGRICQLGDGSSKTHALGARCEAFRKARRPRQQRRCRHLSRLGLVLRLLERHPSLDETGGRRSRFV